MFVAGMTWVLIEQTPERIDRAVDAGLSLPLGGVALLPLLGTWLVMRSGHRASLSRSHFQRSASVSSDSSSSKPGGVGEQDISERMRRLISEESGPHGIPNSNIPPVEWLSTDGP